MIRETLTVVMVPLAFIFYCCMIQIFKQINKDTDEHKFTIVSTVAIILLWALVEMIDRYIKRGNQKNFVTMLENNYKTFVNDLMSDPNNKIVLDSGQYLKDVVRFI